MDSVSKGVVLLNLAKRIKNLRIKKGVTQQNAYNDTGIHFARIEQGKRDISYTTIHKICIYFDITKETFFKEL
jgi:transcriptional regulator with XRE-family HTH domain